MRLTRTLKVDDAHEDAVWCCAWAPSKSGGGKSSNSNNYELVTGSVDETVKVWSIDRSGGAGASSSSEAAATTEGGGEDPSSSTFEPLRSLPGHTLGAISVAVDASGTFAASSSLDSFVRIWYLDDSVTKAVIETPPGETWQIAFPPVSNDGGPQLIAAAGGASNKVVLWSADTAEKVAEMSLPEPTARGGAANGAASPSSASPSGGPSPSASSSSKDRFVLSVAYSPDGKRIACGSMDGGVALFDVASGKLLTSLPGHHRPVRSVAFSADSTKVLTACDDMHSHVYDATNGALVAALGGHASWVTAVAPHPGGVFAATASSDSTVKLWDLRSAGGASGPLQTAREHSDQVWGVSWSGDGTKLASVSDDKSVCVYAAG